MVTLPRLTMMASTGAPTFQCFNPVNDGTPRSLTQGHSRTPYGMAHRSRRQLLYGSGLVRAVKQGSSCHWLASLWPSSLRSPNGCRVRLDDRHRRDAFATLRHTLTLELGTKKRAPSGHVFTQPRP